MGAFADGEGVDALFNKPTGLTIDGHRNIFVADRGNSRIRVITPDGRVSTIAGSGEEDFADGPASSAHFARPRGVAISLEGDLIVADTRSNRVRIIEHVAVPLPRNLLQSTFAYDMQAIWAGSTLSDVVFMVDKERISAHRVILVGRSEYFAKLLTSNFKEGNTSCIVDIKDTSAAAFKAVLHYLYTDTLSFSEDVIIEVMHLADRYHIPRIFHYCLQHCRQHSVTANAIERLVVAHKYHLEELRASMLQFVALNFKSIHAENSASLERLCEHPDLMKELMILGMA